MKIEITKSGVINFDIKGKSHCVCFIKQLKPTWKENDLYYRFMGFGIFVLGNK